MENAKAERQSKHIVISNATDAVFQQIAELEKLVDEIRPQPKPAEDKTSKETKGSAPPSLSSFLNSEAERLDMAANRIGEAVSELRNLLF